MFGTHRRKRQRALHGFSFRLPSRSVQRPASSFRLPDSSTWRRFARLLTIWPARLALVAAIAVPEVAGQDAQRHETPAPEWTVSGHVLTAARDPIAGATVATRDGVHVTSGPDGTFQLTVPPGRHVLRVEQQGFVPVERELDVQSNLTGLDFQLSTVPRFSDEVTVAAVRATPETPFTKRELDRLEINRLDYGQELPFLLNEVPAITYYSDAGMGAGYSYVMLRGIPQTRMNITLDGAPLNEPEDSAFYFSNFGELASAVESIQVQRGVGTSTVGAASFVGSINFASIAFADQPRADVRLETGSFGTNRVSAAMQSGRLAHGLKFYGQAAYHESDGFRRNSGVTQRSLYLGASRETGDSFFKALGFLGREASSLAFLATDEATLSKDLRFNPLTPEERDRFGQNFFQAQYHRALGTDSEVSVQGYYNGAGGWYRIRDARATSGLFEYGLDWRMVGVTASWRWTRGPLDLTWGGHANDFTSRHTRESVGAPREYENHGFKNEVNTFLKAGYDQGRWHHFGDVQLRWARFRYEGNQDLGAVSWTFLSPKLGTRYDLGRGASVYGSVGSARREPGRQDMLAGEDNASVPYDLRAVRPERVVDVESGIDIARPGVAVQANVYFMEFRDEIALTGELSEIGLPLRRNVDASYRRGLEVDVQWRPVAPLRVHPTLNLSHNRIRRWTQFYDVYDETGAWVESQAIEHGNVPPLLTPSIVATLGLEYVPREWVSAGALARYTGESSLDNTGRQESRAPAFLQVDATAALSLARLLPFAGSAEPRLRLQVNNLLDNHRMFPSGYTYVYFVRDTTAARAPDQLDTTRYFYPLATRHAFVGLEMKF